MKKGPRYDDPCGIARAIDRVGERWGMLVVRELFFGPLRFVDLKRGLPHASPNVLSQRLDELEEDGIVEHRLPERTYGLTERGRELEDVLLALGRWGSRAAPIPTGELSVPALLLALRTTFTTTEDVSIELGFGTDRYRARVVDGALTIERGESTEPDAIVETDRAVLRRVVFGALPLADARKTGGLRIEGSIRAASRFLSAFARPKRAGT